MPSSHEAILLVTRPPIDAAWLEEELDALESLVEEGETLELVGRLNTLVGAAAPCARLRRRSGRREDGARIRVGLAADLRARGSQQQQLPVLALLDRRRVVATGNLRVPAVRLDVHEERAGAEDRRRVDDAARLPGAALTVVERRNRLVRLRRRPAAMPW